ncbi:HTH cro/C1-type domain-containing protein [Burkholderia multivorans]
MVESKQLPIRYPDFAARLQKAMAGASIEIQGIVDFFKARGAKITYEMVRRYTLGQAMPRQEKLNLLAEAVGRPAPELVYGRLHLPTLSQPKTLEELEGEIREILEIDEMVETQERAAEVIDVPRFDARGSMGNGFPVPEHDRVIEHIKVTKTWVRDVLPSVTNPSNLALLPAFGDSMESTFSDGDLLWVDRGVNEVKIDAIYVLALRDELYVKRLQRRPDGAVLMISDNKAYEPYLIQNGEREKFRVLGRVVFAWRGKRL